MTEDDAEPAFGRSAAGQRQRWPSSGSGRSAGSNSSGSSGGPAVETVRAKLIWYSNCWWETFLVRPESCVILFDETIVHPELLLLDRLPSCWRPITTAAESRDYYLFSYLIGFRSGSGDEEWFTQQTSDSQAGGQVGNRRFPTRQSSSVAQRIL